MDTPTATGSNWNPLISSDSVTNDLIQVYEAEINKQQVNMRKKKVIGSLESRIKQQHESMKRFCVRS